MTTYTRRGALAIAGGATLGAAAGCGNGVGSAGADTIERRVAATRRYLFDIYPATQELEDKAVGVLWMPLVTEASLGFGGAYGRGALRVGEATVDYYSAASASVGFQAGAQQYAHALFFMTEPALAEFRRGAGWSAGGDLEYAFNDRGGTLSAATLTSLDPIVAVVFGQAGLIAGASLNGTKYTRIIP